MNVPARMLALTRSSSCHLSYQSGVASRPGSTSRRTPKIAMHSLIRFTLLAFLLNVSLTFAASIEGKRPNIIFILTDDQGYGDISAHGNPILKTPNMDRLHNEGVRFLDFHVSPTCSPTRSALHTGRHEFRNGITHTILERERMTLKATTLPQVLKTAGYTTAIFGKWHLGDETEYQPEKRGYDERYASHHGSPALVRQANDSERDTS